MADYEDFLSLDPPNFFMAELLTAISELEFSHQKYKHEYENEERRAIEEKTKERNDAVSFLIIGSDAHSMAHDAVQLLIRKLEEVVRRLERVDNQLTISADEHMLIISFSGSNAGRPNQLKRQCQQHIDYLADEVSEVISARSVIHEQSESVCSPFNPGVAFAELTE